MGLPRGGVGWGRASARHVATCMTEGRGREALNHSYTPEGSHVPHTAVVNIDIYHSREVNELQAEGKRLFDRFHELVRQQVEQQHGGSLYSTEGDGATATFKDSPTAVRACADILERLGAFNEEQSAEFPDSPLYARIGLTVIEGELRADETFQERNRGQSDLFAVHALQKHAPVGRIAISRAAYNQLYLEKELFRYATTEPLRREGALVSRGRQRTHYAHLLKGLPHEKREAIPPIHFTSWNRLAPPDISLATVRRSLEEPLLVILGDTQKHPYSGQGSAATSDAAAVIELMSELPRNQRVAATVDTWKDATDLAGDRNVLLVGSGACNGYSFAINDLIEPLHFLKHSGSVQQELAATCRTDVWRYGARQRYGEYCGLVVHCRSPFNSRGSLLWAAGLTGRGTQAATRLVIDLARDAESTFKRHRLPLGFEPIACVVGVPFEPARREPPTDRRLFKYELLWAADAAGRHVELKPTGTTLHEDLTET